MSGARERILSSVRAGLVRAVLPDAPASSQTAPGTEVRSHEELLAQFSAAFVSLKGTVVRVAVPGEVAQAVADIAARHGAASFLAWDDEAIGCPGLSAALATRGLARVPANLPATELERLSTLRALGAAGLGITGADAALADTGSLVLLAGPGRSRLTSALPPVHVAVTNLDRLVPSLGALFETRPGLLDESSNAVVITGPSRTADIEMTLTHGVHGPKHLYAVLVG